MLYYKLHFNEDMEYNPVNELSNKEQLSKSYCLLVLITTLFYLLQIQKPFYKQKGQIRKFATGKINVSEHVSVSSTKICHLDALSWEKLEEKIKK